MPCNDQNRMKNNRKDRQSKRTSKRGASCLCKATTAGQGAVPSGALPDSSKIADLAITIGSGKNKQVLLAVSPDGAVTYNTDPECCEVVARTLQHALEVAPELPTSEARS